MHDGTSIDVHDRVRRRYLDLISVTTLGHFILTDAPWRTLAIQPTIDTPERFSCRFWPVSSLVTGLAYSRDGRGA